MKGKTEQALFAAAGGLGSEVKKRRCEERSRSIDDEDFTGLIGR